MANKVGNLIKKARTGAGMTQEQLARKVRGVSANDISRAERGQLKLSNDALKQIAKATGVTQQSLLDAAASSSYSSGSSSSSSSSSSGSKSSMSVTATERRLVELYRKADASAKKQAMATLRGTESEIGNAVGDLLENAIDALLKK